MVVTVTVTRHGLHREVRKPSFAPQSFHDGDGGSVNVTIGAALVRLCGDDGGHVTPQGFVVEGFAAADLVSMAVELGGQMVVRGTTTPRVEVQHCAATLAVAETWCARGKSGRRRESPGLQRMGKSEGWGSRRAGVNEFCAAPGAEPQAVSAT